MLKFSLKMLFALVFAVALCLAGSKYYKQTHDLRSLKKASKVAHATLQELREEKAANGKHYTRLQTLITDLISDYPNEKAIRERVILSLPNNNSSDGFGLYREILNKQDIRLVDVDGHKGDLELLLLTKAHPRHYSHTITTAVLFNRFRPVDIICRDERSDQEDAVFEVSDFNDDGILDFEIRRIDQPGKNPLTHREPLRFEVSPDGFKVLNFDSDIDDAQTFYFNQGEHRVYEDRFDVSPMEHQPEAIGIRAKIFDTTMARRSFKEEKGFRYEGNRTSMSKLLYVYKIVDGDTVCLHGINGTNRTLKLASIEAPEIGQPFANAAKEFLEEQILDKKVTVYVTGMDGKGYDLGYVSRGDWIVNDRMLEEGLAWHDTRSSNSKKLAELEQSAREKTLNIWSAEHPVAPWKWQDKE